MGAKDSILARNWYVKMPDTAYSVRFCDVNRKGTGLNHMFYLGMCGISVYPALFPRGIFNGIECQRRLFDILASVSE